MYKMFEKEKYIKGSSGLERMTFRFDANGQSHFATLLDNNNK